MKSYAEYIGQLTASEDARLSEHDSGLLAGALLDGGVPELELGAILARLSLQATSSAFVNGLVQALGSRTQRWRSGNQRLLPVSIGCYAGSWETPDLAPLLGLVLARMGVPVILHGPLHAHAGVSSAIVLRALGVMPSAHHQQVADELERRRIAFVPDALLAPGLASLLALRARLGPVPALGLGARLIAPFEPDSLLMVWAEDSDELRLLREVLAAQGIRALLMHVSNGESFGRELRRPRIEYWRDSACQVLFTEDRPLKHPTAHLPEPSNADAIAGWMRQAFEGAQAVPLACQSQIAACLYATGYCDDFSQAKALAAVSVNVRQVA
jgi:anthranilate phosphoribosyltransferase